MRTRTFAGNQVGAVGLGCMGLSGAYGPAEQGDEASQALVREAVELGVTFLDTSDVYGDGHNETLLGQALGGGLRDQVTLATKVGLFTHPETEQLTRDASPERVRRAVDDSLRRLNADVIDLYYLHRIDPAVPLAETWGAMAELVEAGKVRRLGLSEVSVAQADEAHAVHPVAAIQSELSLWTRGPLGGPGEAAGGLPGESASTPSGGPQGSGDIVGWCAARDAVFVPFSPLGRGFLTGTITAASFDEEDFRGRNPRFQAEAIKQNQRIVDVVRTVADRHGATPAQVALAWVLAQGDHIIPIPGTKKSRYLHQNAEAADLDLTREDIAELDAVPAPIGARY